MKKPPPIAVASSFGSRLDRLDARRDDRAVDEVAAEVARLASDRFAKESKTRERLKNGELGLDFYGLRARLTELGVRYEDGTD